MAQTKLNIEQVLDLSSVLEEKASTVHTHAIGDVDGLQDALDNAGGEGVYLPLTGGDLTGEITATNLSGTNTGDVFYTGSEYIEVTSGNEIRLKVTVSPTEPSSPALGDLWIEA